MHTQQTATAAAPIYWTTQAREEFDARIRATVAERHTPGGQIVTGNHACAIDRQARAQGAERVNRQVVQEYFARLADGGRR